MAMTDAEAVTALTKTNETLVKVSNETDALLRDIEKLEKELAASGGVGGTIVQNWKQLSRLLIPGLTLSTNSSLTLLNPSNGSVRSRDIQGSSRI
jgi:hypothetical protein